MNMEILEVDYKWDICIKQVRVQVIIKEFQHIEIDENEGVIEFIAQVQKMTNQLRMNVEDVPLNRVTETNLRDLTNDFESIVVPIEETNGLSTLTRVRWVITDPQIKEEKKKRKLEDQALQAQFDLNGT